MGNKMQTSDIFGERGKDTIGGVTGRPGVASSHVPERRCLDQPPAQPLANGARAEAEAGPTEIIYVKPAGISSHVTLCGSVARQHPHFCVFYATKAYCPGAIAAEQRNCQVHATGPQT